MANYYKYILNVFIICILAGCQDKKTFIYKFNQDKWDIKQDTVMFTYNAQKVDTPYTISLFFRNNINYPYRNIYMFVDILYNHNIIQTDTLQYAITDKYGRWYGKGIGNTKDNYFLFESNLQFQNVGAYTFNITHGMRNNPLVGCDKIGLKISEK